MSLKVAIIGQSPFAVDVMERIVQHGHKVVGVFTIPDKGKREDPLGKQLVQYSIYNYGFSQEYY